MPTKMRNINKIDNDKFGVKDGSTLANNINIRG